MCGRADEIGRLTPTVPRRRFEVMQKDFRSANEGCSKVLVPDGSTQKSRHLCRSLAETVRKIGNFVTKGYHFHIWGMVPEGKTGEEIDRTMGRKHPSILLSLPAKRQRFHRHGEARLQYLRFGRWWIILATHGNGPFWLTEVNNVRKHEGKNAKPIVFWGYSLSYRNGKFHARIRAEEFKRLKRFFLEVAARWDLAWWKDYLWELPFEPYAPVLRQIGGLVRRVNKVRQTAGLEKIPESYIRVRRNLSG
jgi:hypothetical protein